MERVAEVAADGALAHVRADQPDLALAVLAQRPQERRRPRRPGGGHEHRDALHARSILSAARRSRSRCCSAASIARIVSPIVSPGIGPDLGVRQQLEPAEQTRAQMLVRAAGAPDLVRVGAVGRGREPGRLHDVDRALDRRAHVPRLGVVPRDDRVEPLVGRRVRVHGVQADAVTELTQPRERVLALGRVEVVEDRLRHQEVRRAGAGVRLELRHAERRVEREIDVVAEDQVAVGGLALEEPEAIAARRGRLQQLGVVLEVERAAHCTSTSSSRAACSARCSASTDVSAVAIT